MNFLYADNTNGVFSSDHALTARDVVNDEEFLDAVIIYDNENDFFDALSCMDDNEVAICNAISDEMYAKISKNFNIKQ